MRMKTQLWMPAITLYQPWASFVVHLLKPLETRGHSRFACLQGQHVAIHAAAKFDADWMDAIAVVFGYDDADKAQRVLNFCREMEDNGGFPRQAVLGIAYVDDARWMQDDRLAHSALCCTAGRFGLFLKDIERL